MGPSPWVPGTACRPGWWRRDIRLQFRPVFRTVETPEPRTEWRTPSAPSHPLLILGANGTLGKALARACEWRGIDYRLTGRSELSLDDDPSVHAALPLRQGRAIPWIAEAFEPVRDQLTDSGALVDGAWIVLEHAARNEPPVGTDARELRFTRTYGDTALTFYRHKAMEVE